MTKMGRVSWDLIKGFALAYAVNLVIGLILAMAMLIAGPDAAPVKWFNHAGSAQQEGVAIAVAAIQSLLSYLIWNRRRNVAYGYISFVLLVVCWHVWNVVALYFA